MTYINNHWNVTLFIFSYMWQFSDVHISKYGMLFFCDVKLNWLSNTPLIELTISQYKIHQIVDLKVKKNVLLQNNRLSTYLSIFLSNFLSQLFSLLLFGDFELRKGRVQFHVLRLGLTLTLFQDIDSLFLLIELENRFRTIFKPIKEMGSK